MKRRIVGIVEGFFGPQWNNDNRLGYAEFLSSVGADFFIYAPKQDSKLRKSWKEDWDEAYLEKLSELRRHFHKHGIQFGLGLSPFGLGKELSKEDENVLERRMRTMEELQIDLLGLFFDDMPITDHLADTQIKTLEFIQKFFKNRIIFCPSFYSPDPILEKVFGKMPAGYLEEIGKRVSSTVSIAWTGPKVISPQIDRDHLVNVANVLKRKPFIWENFFANDGPKNCKFLKLKSFTGRSLESFNETEGFAFNLMNQPELSKIAFLAAKLVLDGLFPPEEALRKAILDLTSVPFQRFLLNHSSEFLEKGLDGISEESKYSYIRELAVMNDPAAKEIQEWLEGKYLVDSECLTD